MRNRENLQNVHFLNGRIDLSQAEAVMDLIRAKTDRAMNVALNQMEGKLSRLIGELRQALLKRWLKSK